MTTKSYHPLNLAFCFLTKASFIQDGSIHRLQIYKGKEHLDMVIDILKQYKLVSGKNKIFPTSSKSYFDDGNGSFILHTYQAL